MNDVEIKIDSDIEEMLGEITDKGAKLILYNDDHHDVMDVTMQVMKACECGARKAASIMLEAHTKGKAIALVGSKAKCEKAAGILREIALQCEVIENE